MNNILFREVLWTSGDAQVVKNDGCIDVEIIGKNDPVSTEVVISVLRSAFYDMHTRVQKLMGEIQDLKERPTFNNEIAKFINKVLFGIEELLLDGVTEVATIHQYMKRNDPFDRWCKICLAEVGDCGCHAEDEGDSLNRALNTALELTKALEGMLKDQDRKVREES